MSRISWPQSLVRAVAERRCIIVLGAGASAASKNENGDSPESWDSLLLHGCGRIADPAARSDAEELIKSGKMLDAAQVMSDAMGSADFQLWLRESFVDPKYLHNEIHEHMQDLDVRIVATTNVDSIYEDYVTSVAGVGAYATVFNHEGRLVHALRTEGRLVVKIHGCVSRVEKVVFNREQYFSAKRNYPEFYAGLGALFLTNTLLFIGSGFNGDPDLDLLLQDSLIAGSDATPYYAILEAGRPAAVHRAMERSFNVKFLEYEGGQYNQVAASLGELVDLVQEYRTLHP